MLTSSQTILELRDTATCTFETDREEGGRGHVFVMDRDTWEDMGRPSTISLLIEPGDALNG